jgi:hypothetical protein
MDAAVEMLRLVHAQNTINVFSDAGGKLVL